jgi:hypothetical protein
LLFRQWPLTPIRERFPFRKALAEHLLNKRTVTERIAETQQPGCDLQVEQVAGHLVAGEVTKPNLFAAGVNDHHAPRIDNQLPECFERFATERIDEDELLGRSHLDQAQIGNVGFLADEFRVETDDSAGREMFATGSQRRGVGNDGLD